MSATNRHHRMLLTAAGLAMSGALMVACGHAHGERATNGNGNSADSAAVSTTPAESSSSTTPSATNPSGMSPSTTSPSTTTPSSINPATTNGTSTARHHRTRRDSNYANPSSNPSSQPSASEPASAATGGNATASATTTTRHHGRKPAVNGAESTDNASSAVPDQTASATTPTARRHRGAAETSNTETAKTDTSNASPNAESASNGLSVSGANAMPVGATCTAAAPGASYESSYSPTAASLSTPANVTVSSDVQSAKDQSRRDTAASHAQQPYDINRPNDASSLSKTPTNTPDTVGGSLGHRDTTASAVRRDTSANAYGNWSVTASQPRHDTASASSMTVATNNNPSASVSVGTSGQSGNAVSSISSSGTLPPCGWPAGAKGAFLNDAQVADAAIIANSVDSAISAGIAAKTQNAAVRDYAQMMIRDHSEANSQLASLVDRTKIAPAENEIADGIVRDTTGHTFAAPASTTAMNRVEGQKVTPVTQPQAQPSKTNVPAAPKPAHIDTVEAPAMGGTGSNPAVKDADTRVNVYDYNSPSSTSAKPDTTKVTAPTMAAPTTTAAPSTTASQPLTGDDKNYIDFMVQAHQQLLDALDNRLIPFAWNPDLKSALTAMRPVVQRHLDRARELQRGQTTTSQY